MSELRQVDEMLWEIPAGGAMRVPARIFADDELLGAIAGDKSLEQLRNVATLPGIVDAALAMPDIHQGRRSPSGRSSAAAASSGRWAPATTSSSCSA